MTLRSQPRLPLVLFIAHAVALIFGLVGILIMLPNPSLWANDPNAVKVFNWSMEYAGSTHIIFGALAMFAFGVYAIGWRKTLIFFAISYPLSLTSELLGTGTGWPFGNYAYTDFLGWKVLDHVPYTIPLSWFYMGFASYLLASVIVAAAGFKAKTAWTLALAVWFLTVWDLVLDPAMAHDSLRVKFWTWDEAGPYFGMPIKNFIGWSVTGLLYMAIARKLWRRELDGTRIPALFPFAVYAINVAFAMILSAGVSLYIPILLAAILGLLPACLALWTRPPASSGSAVPRQVVSRPSPSR